VAMSRVNGDGEPRDDARSLVMLICQIFLNDIIFLPEATTLAG
jgi:hypothetical protein